MIRALEYNNLYLGTLKLNEFGYIIERRALYNKRAYRNKIAFWDDEKYQVQRSRFDDYIEGACRYPDTCNAKLYVCSEVKTPRDVYRNSGYQIVRDPDKADYIVLPFIDPDAEYLYVDFMTISENKDLTVYTLSVRHDNRIDNDEQDFWMQKLTDYFSNRNVTFGWNCIRKNCFVHFLPKCEHYVDIIEKKHPERKYVMDSTIPLNPTVTISPETLMLWEHYTDNNMLTKSIIASDWRKYPLTLVCFLDHCFPSLDEDSYGEGFKTVAKTIGYNSAYTLSMMMRDRFILPEDAAMLQSWLMAELGLSEQGGWIEPAKLKSLGSLRDFVKKMTYVSPIKITTPVSLCNFFSMTGEN